MGTVPNYEMPITPVDRKRGLSPLVAAILSTAILAGCAAAGDVRKENAAGTGRVLARLVSGEKALPGAVVTAVENPGVGFREKVLRAAATGETAELSLPAGSWYLSARSADGAVFGFYGPNPLLVRSGEELLVSIRGVEGNEPPRIEEEVSPPGGVEGVVTAGDGGLAGAVVALYLDASTQFRGPAYVEVETDGEGRFFAPVSPGRYFVVVRRRTGTGGSFGPLSVGDHFGYYGYNPLTLREGERAVIRVAAVEVLRRTGWKEPSSLRALVSGVVRDSAGDPLAGYRVFLHTHPDMLGKPEFVSRETGPDGAYEIWAERAGTYYLGARALIGLAREKGEVIGFYRGSRDHTIRIEKNGEAMRDLDVVVGAERPEH
jgi:hypothetical protein